MNNQETAVVTVMTQQLARTTFSISILGRNSERLFSELLENTTCNTASFIGICRAHEKFKGKIILTDNRTAKTWASGAPINSCVPNKVAENYSRLIQEKVIRPNVTCIS